MQCQKKCDKARPYSEIKSNQKSQQTYYGIIHKLDSTSEDACTLLSQPYYIKMVSNAIIFAAFAVTD